MSLVASESRTGTAGECSRPSTTWEQESVAQMAIGVMRGHTAGIQTIDLDWDNQLFISGGDDSVIFLWDLEEGEVIETFNLHTEEIAKVKLSNIERRFLSCSFDCVYSYCDITSGAVLWSHTQDVMPTCGDVRDQLVAVGLDVENAIMLHDIRVGKAVKRIEGLHDHSITSVRLCPLSPRIVTTSMDCTTKFFDLRSLRATVTLGGHTNVVSNCALTPDERLITTVSWDKQVMLWDVATGTYRDTGPISLGKGHENSVSSAAFTSSGEFLATGSYDCTVYLWDLANNVPRARLQGHTAWVNDVAISPDGKWVFSASKDATIRRINVEKLDNSKLAIINRRAIGIHVVKCSDCDMMYSIGDMGELESAEMTYCVLCRIKRRDNTVHVDKKSANKTR